LQDFYCIGLFAHHHQGVNIGRCFDEHSEDARLAWNGETPTNMNALMMVIEAPSVAADAGLLKTKNRFYSKDSEQCINAVFFRPAMPSSSRVPPILPPPPRASTFFLPEQAGFLIKLL
jgi:hypothetical protein